MNKFLKDLEKELKKLKVNAKEIEEILADHKEMMEAAKQEGLNEEEISNKFGDPVKVASELHEDAKGNPINFDDIECSVKFDIEKFTLVKEFEDIPEDLEFKVSLVNDDYILCDYDGDKIKVYQLNVKEIDKYDIKIEKNLFTLQREKGIMKFSMSFRNNNGIFLVLMPKGLKHKSFNYSTVSGEVAINNLVVESFKLKSTNGDIMLSNVNLGESKFNLVNGDVEIEGLKALSLEISLVNGDIEFTKGLIKKHIYFNSVSGDVELRDVECDTAAFKTVSGDVEGVNFYVNEIQYKSVSGDLEIHNEDKSREINVISKKTVSGDVNIN